jgi:hypothetical protein
MTQVGGLEFRNYGSHCDEYPYLPYFTAAAAIGQTKHDVDAFIIKLTDAYLKLKS